MKRKYLYTALITTIVVAVFTACRKEGTIPHMSMITNVSGEVTLFLNGSGDAIIQWGDGTADETYTFLGYWSPTQGREFTGCECKHTYSDAGPHRIIIIGKNITTLYCRFLQLTSLDVSKNPVLLKLVCSNNQLTSLDVSRNLALLMINCEGNQLTSLDVSRNLALSLISCEGNQLTNLDVSENKALFHLSCADNQLTILDVSETDLETLKCDNNQLTILNVSGNSLLLSLFCNNNQLTNLDISTNTQLGTLICNNNQLTSLDVSNPVLARLDCSTNNLSINALNDLFVSLPITSFGTIFIDNNPGTDACERSIATDKGWNVLLPQHTDSM